MQQFSLATFVRHESEEYWHRKVDEAEACYRKANAQYVALTQQRLDGEVYLQHDPLALARRTLSEAMAEYTRVLKIFTDLAVYGVAPLEQSVEPQTNGDGDWRKNLKQDDRAAANQSGSA